MHSPRGPIPKTVSLTDLVLLRPGTSLNNVLHFTPVTCGPRLPCPPRPYFLHSGERQANLWHLHFTHHEEGTLLVPFPRG